ncbi:unnamed protein product [Prorocentrum cordatum]|uniref:Uncharacterized protein n=1 Tax=Prorocentrum cordatum TaxID=2364126 RepID=A0ABN9SMY4_9DINO|nr:unnamed protein product [Polarella glacialis]
MATSQIHAPLIHACDRLTGRRFHVGKEGARRREGGGKEGRKARQSGTDAEAWGPPPVAPARGTPAHAPSARPSSRGPRRARAREGRPPVAGLGLPPRPAGRILGGSQAGPASTFACRARTLRHDN